MQTEYHLNTTGCLKVFPDHSEGYIEQNSVQCQKFTFSQKLIIEHENEFTILQWLLQSERVPTELLWDVLQQEIIMEVQLTNLL